MISSRESIAALGIKNKTITNWSETSRCQPELYFEPKTIEEMRQILILGHKEKKVVRVMGCGQSPSGLPFTNDYLVNMRHFNNVLSVNEELCQIKIEGGVTFRELTDVHLVKHNLALCIVAAILDISVAGAVSTATHQSGIKYGTVASYVLDMEVMMSDGSIVKCSREEKSELFLAVCCGLGAMGVIINLTMQCEKAYNMREDRLPATFTEVLECLDVHLTSSDHFRFYWFPHTENVLVDHISRTTERISKQSQFSKLFSWLRDIVIGYHSLEFFYWISTFFPFLVPKINACFFTILNGSSKTRVDRSDKVLNIECLFKQFVCEWAIPIEKTAVALYKLKEWLALNPTVFVHFPIEVRFVKSEDFYLSPTYGRDSCYINLVMYRPYKKAVEHERYWAAFADIMKSCDGRPHWAKGFDVTGKEFDGMYPKYKTWCDLRKKYDSSGIFLSQFLNNILYA